MNIVERRGRWVLTDANGMVSKFATKKEAQDAAGWTDVLDEIFHGGETEEKKDSKEKTSTDEQTLVRSSEGSSKEKV
jgi:hypothetical protein